MEQQDASVSSTDRPALLGSYLKLILAVLVGAGLGLGIYLLLAKRNQASNSITGGTDRLCACPNCGMTIPKPAGLDCEEVNCPSCGTDMSSAAMLAGLAGNPAGTFGAGAVTQNRIETLAEQGIVMPMAFPGLVAQQPAGLAFAPPLNEDLRCVCPVCGATAEHQPGVPCSHMSCPNCQSLMTNSIPVGRQKDMRLVGMGGSGSQPGGTAPCQGAGAGAAPPCATGAVVGQPGVQTTTYSNTIKGIIERNCLRCHSGPIRNLYTYEQVKAYANNGLLEVLTQPGGPMSRFLTAEESHQISTWIDAGAPP